jgi:uncharacterized LabA/DUF88 family protein
MINKYIMGKVVVFIDAANLESSLKDLGWRMDYGKLYQYFSKNNNLVRISYYSARFDNIGHDNFLTVLKRSGFKLITKKVKNIYNGKYTLNKANFDVEISLDAVSIIDQYKTLILFSGDSDFDYLVKHLKLNNKKVIVVSSQYHISNELVTCCDKYIDISKLENIFRRFN